MKAKYAIVIGIAALAIGIMIGRWGERDSLNGEEPKKPTAEGEASAEPSPPAPEPRIDRTRLLPETAAVYLHIDVPQLTAERDSYRVVQFLRRPEASQILASFFEKSRPALINAVTETLSYRGKELDFALVPKNLESGEGEPQLSILGKVDDATRDLDAFLRVGIAPLLAGDNVSTSTEELMGLPLIGAAGPKGGLFWTHKDGEFVAARSKEILTELLKSRKPSPEVESASEEDLPAAWGEDPITFHVDLERAQKTGIIPSSPDPNAPVLLSALALAAGKGFDNLHLSGGYQESAFCLSVKLSHKEELPPPWSMMRVGTEIYDQLPTDSLVALAFPLAGVPPSTSRVEEGASVAAATEEVAEATPIQVRFVERLVPAKMDLLKPALMPASGVLLVGVSAIEVVGGIPGYFLSVPYPGAEVTEGILNWAKEEGATVESAAFGDLEIYGLDFGEQPLFGAAELARLVMAKVADRLVVATHPDLLKKLDPAEEMDLLGKAEEFGAFRALLTPGAALRGYVSPSLLDRVLGAYRERLDWKEPGAADMDHLLRAAEVFSAPLFISIGADRKSLELQIVTPSEVAAMVAAAILHRAATTFLVEG